MADACGQDVIDERARNHERMLDEHEHRLNDHEKRIRTQESHSGVMDANFKHLCARVDGLTKALWGVAAAAGMAAFTYFFDLIKGLSG